MTSKIQEAIKMKFEPVAIIWSDEKPADALQFTENKWGCIMAMFAQAATGKTAVFDYNTYGCIAASWGLGFGSRLNEWSGGEECFYYFLSNGNDNWEEGRQKAEELKPTMRQESYEHFVHGERFLKTPELVKKWLDNMPIIKTDKRYVIFKPLKDVSDKEEIKIVIFPVDANQLSALVVLANFGRETNENVYAPFSAGCQSVGVLAYSEMDKEFPRAIIGNTDISSRLYSSHLMGTDLLTFAVPYKMYLEMEGNVDESFLRMHTWARLMEKAGM
jgi:uncharacterized protein (DUF169 family)